MTYRELVEKRQKILAEQRRILDKADAMKRDMTAEESQKYDDLEARFDDVTRQINKLNRYEQQRSDPIRPMPDNQDHSYQPETRVTIYKPGEFLKASLPKYTPLERKYFNEYLDRGHLQISEEVRSFFEARAVTLQMDKSITGGFLVAPVAFQNQLIKDLHDLSPMRGLCTQITAPRAQEIRYPVLASNFDDSDWTAELKTGAQDDLSFESRIFRPHPSAKRCKVSRDLLYMTDLADSTVRNELSYAHAVTEERAFLQGTGSGQPLGIFINSTSGISDSRDVTIGATSTNTTMDHLIEVTQNLKVQYRRRCTWVGHRDFYTRCRKLKTGDGQYIWQPSTEQGRPDRLLGYNCVESEYAPNDFSASQYVAILGDFAHYFVVTAMAMTVSVLVELYAESNEIGYIARMLVDGSPVRENAFSRAKLAA